MPIHDSGGSCSSSSILSRAFEIRSRAKPSVQFFGTSSDRPTEMAQKAELKGQAETVVRGTLGLDQIQLGTAERAVPDQALLVRRHVDKGGPLIGFKQGTARQAQSPSLCLRWIAHIHFTWLLLHPASSA